MSSSSLSKPSQNPPKLLDQVRSATGVRQDGIEMEAAHIQWITLYALFHDKRHPLEMGSKEISRFHSHVIQPLPAHLFRLKEICDHDLGEGFGDVRLPSALEWKHPNAHMEWGLQHLFPSPNHSTELRIGIERRHQLSETVSFRSSNTMLAGRRQQRSWNTSRY
jgi:hypothetical protein